MAKKRKHDSKSAEPTEPPQKQQLQEPKLEPEPQPEPENQINNEGEDVYEEEVEEELEEEVEEEDDNDNDNQTAAIEPSTEDDDDEPIWNLLEPFSKEQLVNLLSEAANMHKDVADLIRKRADEDPVHRKIFVHGLGWDTKADTLISVFKQYGEIEDCKAVVDKVSGKSKGYGFILFKSRSGARKALVEPQKKIGNRITSCQFASVGPTTGASSVVGGSSQHQQQQVLLPPGSEYTQKKIYVSNVGADVDPQKILAFFSQFGEIEEGPLGLDKLTGKPKGFCLFVYKTVESARKALEEPHRNFEGHILNVQRAIDGPKPGKQQFNQQNKHNRNDNGGGYSGGAGGRGGHMMGQSGMAPAAAQGLNPLGHALTAILASQGAGLGLNPALGQALFGSLGATNPGLPVAGPGMQAPYGAQPNMNPAMMGGYVNQGGYPSQQMGQGGAGRGGQHGYGGGAPYMGH